MVDSFDSPYLQVFRSELKLNLLLSLKEGGKELSDLRDELGSSGSTIIHAFQDLEELNLTRKTEKMYELTSMGEIFSIFLKDASSMMTVLEDFQNFWLRHEVETIPLELLKRIGELDGSYLVQDTRTDLAKVHITFQEILLTSRKVKGASPIFHPDYISVFQNLLNIGAKVQLVLTHDVLDRMLSLVDPRELSEYIVDDMLSIFLLDDLRVALTVTENSFSLGLFSVDGTYDYGMDLISNTESAIKWGEQLFDELLSRSERLDLRQLSFEGT